MHKSIVNQYNYIQASHSLDSPIEETEFSIIDPNNPVELFLQDSPSNSSLCFKNHLEKVQLKLTYLFLNDKQDTEYEGGTTQYDSDIEVTVEAFDPTLQSGNTITSKICTLNIKVNISNEIYNPESIYLIDFTEVYNDLSNRASTNIGFRIVSISVINGKNVPPEAHLDAELIVDRRVQIDNNYTQDLEFLTPSGLELEATYVENSEELKTGAHIYLEWKFTDNDPCNDEEVPIFELQVLRLFNQDFDNTESNLDLNTTIDWNNALTFFTSGIKNGIVDDIFRKRIAFTEGTGYYIWRVRAITDYYKNFTNQYSESKGGIADERNWGDWKYPIFVENDGGNIIEHDLENGFNLIIDSPNNLLGGFFFTQMDEELNWKYERFFTEIGNETKTLEKMSYADNLLNIRQNQKYINSEEIKLVNQYIYDYLGRQAITTLPVPTDATLNLPLGYHNNFANESTNNLYSYEDFDDGRLYPLHNNYNNPDGMDDSAIEEYYSGSTPSSPSVLSEDRVPSSGDIATNSDFHPYTRTKYENNPLSEVKEVTGFGETFSTGENKTTKIVRSNASSDEIISIFGNETPRDNGIRKETVISPDGVVSISYYNSNNQLIATALKHPSTNNLELEELDNIATESVEKEELYSRTIQINFEEKQYNKGGYTTSKTLYFPDDTDIDLHSMIQMDFLNEEEGCVDKCIKCYYKITFKIIDLETMEEVSHGLPSVIEQDYEYTVYDSQNPSLNCIVPTEVNNSVVSLPAGTYLIKKIVETFDEDNNTVINQLEQEVTNEVIEEKNLAFNTIFTELNNIIDNNDGLEDLYSDLDDLVLNQSENWSFVDNSNNEEVSYYEYTSDCCTFIINKIDCLNCPTDLENGDYQKYLIEEVNDYLLSQGVKKQYLPRRPDDQYENSIDGTDNSIIETYNIYPYFFRDDYETASGGVNLYPNSYDQSTNTYGDNSEVNYFDNMIQNMDLDGLNSKFEKDETCDCWVSSVSALKYSGIKIDNSLTEGFEFDESFDLLDVFLSCVDQKYDANDTEKDICYNGYTDHPFQGTSSQPGSPVEGYLSHAFEYFFFDPFADFSDKIESCLRRNSINIDVAGQSYWNLKSYNYRDAGWGNSLDGDDDNCVVIDENTPQDYMMYTKFYTSLRTSITIAEADAALDALGRKFCGDDTYEDIVGDDLDGKSYSNFEDFKNKIKPCMEDACESACDDKFQTFVDRLILLYNNDGISVQGQEFYQKGGNREIIDPNGDGDWDIIEEFRMEYDHGPGDNYPYFYNLPVSTNESDPIPGHTIDMEEIYCMATALVDNCKEACVVDFSMNSNDMEIEPHEDFFKVFSGDFDLQLADPNDTDYSEVQPLSTLNEEKWKEYVVKVMNRLLNELILYNPNIPSDISEYNYHEEHGHDNPIYSGGYTKNFHYADFGCCTSELEYKFNFWKGPYTEIEYKSHVNNVSLEYYNRNMILTLLNELYFNQKFGPDKICISYLQQVNPCNNIAAPLRLYSPQEYNDNTNSNHEDGCDYDLNQEIVSKLLDGYVLLTGFAGTDGKYEILPLYFEFNNDDLELVMPYKKYGDLSVSEHEIRKTVFDLNSSVGCSTNVVYSCDNEVYFKWLEEYDLPTETEVTLDNIETNVKKKCDNIIASEILTNLKNDIASCAFNEAARVVKNYKEKCKEPEIDNFGLSFSGPDYYHYTLYYYDRSGNLVKTVPPNGVDYNASADRYTTMNHTFESTYKYDTKNDVISEDVPDRDYESKFIYNSKNQLVFSYDARQYAMSTNINENAHFFSYNIYDDKGRVIETGQAKVNMNDLSTISTSEGFPVNELHSYLKYYASDNIRLSTFQSSLTKNMYTKTFYGEFDESSSYLNLYPGFPKQGKNLDNRVNLVFRDGDGNPLTFDDRVWTYFSYDLHGNVEWVMYKLNNGENTDNILSYLLGITHYNYDLITGNIKQISYNPGRHDSYYQRYSYDEDQRLTMVETSRYGEIWDKDTRYEYYNHGPLKRTLVGDDKLQGIDYTYTINGWLKAINHSFLSETGSLDPGKDGLTGGDTDIPPDGFGMVINYHSGDYKNNSYTNYNQSDASTLNSGSQLFSGNIGSIAFSEYDSDINNKLNPPELTNAFAYKYDLLNRLISSTGYKYNSFWNQNVNDYYKSSYKYDPNGNLLNIKRNAATGSGPAEIDDLDYSYTYSVGNQNNNNRLVSVLENKITPDVPGLGDIESDPYNNDYEYDASGNLITDERNDIINIEWTADGKVSVINYSQPTDVTKFLYDGFGNRVRKTKNQKSTIYMPEANSKILAIYDSDNSESTEKTAELCFSYLDDGGNEKMSCLQNYDVYTDPLYIETNSVNFIPPLTDQNDNSPNSSEIVTFDLNNKTVSFVIGSNPGVQHIFQITSFGFSATGGNPIVLDEWHIWGNTAEGRIGVRKPLNDVKYHENIFQNPYPTNYFTRELREKRYEMKDHLGNVRLTYTDLKLTNLSTYSDFSLDLVTTTNYYPFGMQMHQRTLGNSAFGSETHRYGFQGQEKDDEIKGEGNSINYKYRMHDPRIGRFFAVDPVDYKYPFWSPYQFAGNMPIKFVDLEGLQPGERTFRAGLLINSLDAYDLEMKMIKERQEAWGNQDPIEALHYVLDGLGFIPGIGEFADGTNAVIYSAKGDYLNAAFSIISLAPLAGDAAAKGFKYSLKAAGYEGKAFKSLNAAKKWLGNAMDYGFKSADAIANKRKLRGALGIAKGSPDRAHHLIPVNLIKKNSNVRKAIDEGFDFNGSINGLAIDKARHTGSHGKYDDVVNEMINEAFSNPDNANKSAKEILEGVSGSLKETLQSSSKKVIDTFEH